MITSLVTAPAVEPVSVEEVKAHLRLEPDFSTDDAYLTGLTLAAREHVEQVLSRKLITQVWMQKLDRWPSRDRWQLPFGNLQSVSSIVYLDDDGTSATWSSAEYIVDTGDPGTICLADGYTWPTESLYPIHPIRITFTCGYGSTASLVPEAIKLAIKVIVADYYENREDLMVDTRTITAVSLKILDRLLWPYRMGWFSA